MSIEILKRACELYTQREVARRIGKSAATINLVLKGTYPNPQRILESVAIEFASLKSDECECPVLGTMHRDVCNKYFNWSKHAKVHKDRLYIQVKEYCKECNYRSKT